MEAEQQCAHCGGDSLLLEYVTRSFGKGAALRVIEGIPMWSCSRCGESYFTAQTMHEIVRIREQPDAGAARHSSFTTS